MKRPGGVTVVAILTLFGAAILSVSSCVFFFVAVMMMSAGDAEEPVSVALAGMGAAGGFSLLILAAVAICLAIGVLKLREWARSMSIAAIAVGFACTLLSLFALRGYVVIPVLPSVVCHLFVLAADGCMVEYLSRARVKQVFNMGTLNFHASLPNDATRRLRSTPIVADATIVHCRREFIMVEDGVQERAATVGAAHQPIRINADIQSWPFRKSGSRRNPQPEIIEKVRRVESIHHWHRQI